MKVTEQLQVSAAQVYDYLEGQMRKDICATNKLKTYEGDLDGFSYKKKLKNAKGMRLTLRLTIGPLIPGKYFEVEYHTEAANNRYFYDLSDVEGGCLVTYYEEGNFTDGTKDKIHSFTSKFRKKVVENTIRENLKKMEETILNQ